MLASDCEDGNDSRADRGGRRKRRRSVTPPGADDRIRNADVFAFMKKAYDDSNRKGDDVSDLREKVMKYELDRAKGHANEAVQALAARTIELESAKAAGDKIKKLEADAISMGTELEDQRREVEMLESELEYKYHTVWAAEQEFAELHSSKVMLIPPI